MNTSHRSVPLVGTVSVASRGADLSVPGVWRAFVGWSRRPGRPGRPGRPSASLVAVAFGIDRLEITARVHGRAVGEAIRDEIERRLRTVLHRRVRLVRDGAGGVGFVVRLAPGIDARRFAESIRLEAVAAPITVRGVYHPVGMTGGVAVLDRGETPAELIGRARHARTEGGRREANRVHRAAGARDDRHRSGSTAVV